MERVCIVGAGVIGSLFAGHLARVCEVSVLTRRPRTRGRPERRRPPRERQERLPRPGHGDGGSGRASRVRRRDRRNEGVGARGGGRRRSRAGSPRRRSMTVLNGIGAEEIVRAHGEWPIVSGVTFMSGTRHSDTHVEYILDTETWLGPYEETPFERVQEIADTDRRVRPQGRGAARPEARPVVEAHLQRVGQPGRRRSRGFRTTRTSPRSGSGRPRPPPPRPRRRGKGGRGGRRHRAPRRPVGDERARDEARVGALPIDARGRRSAQTDGDRPHHGVARPRGGAARRPVPLHTALYALVRGKEESW